MTKLKNDLTHIYLLLFISITCASCQEYLESNSQVITTIPPWWETAPTATNGTEVRSWDWAEITIPPYRWPAGTAFGNGLFVDATFDPTGVSIQNDLLRFKLNPIAPPPPDNKESDFNYRSEIRTAPWQIHHPIGTEQWIGWRYIFGEDYQIDATSPITIYQNHPGERGYSPYFELEIAAFNRPSPAMGGEIQVINGSERIVYPVKPLAKDTLDVVIHVVYGLGEEGMLQVWLNKKLYYSKKTSTIYPELPWGGNNKWGIYHHTFNNSSEDVQSSLDSGIEEVEIFMDQLRILQWNSLDPEYKYNAYQLVHPR